MCEHLHEGALVKAAGELVGLSSFLLSCGLSLGSQFLPVTFYLALPNSSESLFLCMCVTLSVCLSVSVCMYVYGVLVPAKG